MVDKADWIKTLKKPLYDMPTRTLEIVIKHKMNLSNSVATKTTGALKRYFKSCFAEGIKPKSDLRTLMKVVRDEVKNEKIDKSVTALKKELGDKNINDLSRDELIQRIMEDVNSK
tara:strand:+ start:286 stop:630 length:345 start_codon:yes stop_codon:yes gene_type:complete